MGPRRHSPWFQQPRPARRTTTALVHHRAVKEGVPNVAPEHLPGPRVRTARLITYPAARRTSRDHVTIRGATAVPGRLEVDLVVGSHHDQVVAAQAAADLIVLDGHGYYDDARIGRLPIASLRTASGGVTAPGFVLGCCWGATSR